jgi:hypothetical protein
LISSTFISKVVSSAQHFIFLEKESWSLPNQEFLIAPQLDHAPKCLIRVQGCSYVNAGLTMGCFHVEFLEFQSYSKHRNHFDIDSKQTHSEEIQVILVERFLEVMKTFCFDFGEKYEVTLGWSKRFKI